MKRFLWSLLLFASPAFAQRTLVSGTITSAGVPYSGATMVASLTLPVGASGATLNGVQISGTTQRVTFDNNGAFLMQLPDNNVVQPPGTKWRFDITESPGVPPPLGTGPQICSATLTITGASQDVSASFTCPALSTVSGGVTPGTPTNLAFYQTPTTLGSSVFTYSPADTFGTACAVFYTCAIISAQVSNGTGLGIGFDVVSSNSDGEALMFAQPDSSQNLFEENESFRAFHRTLASPTTIGYDSDIQIGGNATPGNCFNAGAGSPPCGIGYYVDVGDNPNNPPNTANGQDLVGVMIQPSFNRGGLGNNLGNVAGTLVLTPAACASTAAGTRPCPGVTPAQESAVNLWGLELQDLKGFGSTSTIGVHVEAQTNPAAGNFAIKVESGGGPSSFDGERTAVNCQLGGAAGTTSPAACTSASAGMIAVPASQTSYTVNTTKVSANSEIVVQQMTDNSGLPSSPTCNAGTTNPIQSARVAGTSFTITLTSVASVTCFKFWIVN